MTSTKQMVITLFIVALICAIVLSFVYAFTSPRIEDTKKELTLQGLKEVINAKKFIMIVPDTVWRAIDSLDNDVGIVIRVFPKGYAGPIPITVGIGLDDKITGIRIASAAEGLKETPGLGAKIIEPEFTLQFVDKSSSQVFIKKDGGEIDAITAATISSRAVCSGIKNGMEKYANYLGAGIDKKNIFPDAQEFIEVIKDSLWFAKSESDTLGIVFFGIAQGYADVIEFIVGVDKQGTITEVDVVKMNETEGIGTMIKDKDFLDSFKQGKPDAITGATVTSQAFIDAVINDVERFKEYLK